MIEYFIAKRYVRSKHKINFITVISIISFLGVMIGVAALIVIISVFNGFSGIVKSNMIELDPHIQVMVTSKEGYKQTDSLDLFISRLDGISFYSPYVEGKIIMMKGESPIILKLKGIVEKEGEEDWGIKDKIYAGEYNLIDKDRSGLDKIYLSFAISNELSVYLGDTIFTTSVNNVSDYVTTMNIPPTRRFIIAGLFKTAAKDFDYQYSFTTLNGAQRVFEMKKNISGFEIRLNDIDDSEEIKNLISEKYSENFSVNTWYDLHKDFYDIMLIERWSAFIILSLIIAVACFNILASLAMSVIEKKKDIGVLKSMGAPDKSILKIFMFEGIFIGVIGTIIGTIVGVMLCFLQIQYKLFPLDPTKYIIDAIPIDLRISDILFVATVSIILTLLASLYPARRAVKIKPADAIKWE
ncbi:MAG: ABC transporter permease [Candidatus Lokiarchaeota archaeon]|nr:ABC transporter permease [Candidatus Lokiarchaeota archaeon]